MRNLTGQTLGRYDIVESLGQGGTAQVYRAVQQPLGRPVAIKVLSPVLVEEPGFVKRFENEARVLAQLDHPNILPIYDFDEVDGLIYIAMPLVRGGTLRDLLDRGPMDTVTAWRYLRETGDALHHAHQAGIVHRDLKPTNILVHADGRALLADFGLARASSDTHLTQVGHTVGTPGYMSPEQVMGHDVDQRTDIYALGVLTFEMLTGRMPFPGTTAMEIAMATVSSPVPSATALNRTLPDELDLLLNRVLAKEPGNRPPTAEILVRELGRLPQRRI